MCCFSHLTIHECPWEARLNSSRINLLDTSVGNECWQSHIRQFFNHLQVLFGSLSAAALANAPCDGVHLVTVLVGALPTFFPFHRGIWQRVLSVGGEVDNVPAKVVVRVVAFLAPFEMGLRKRVFLVRAALVRAAMVIALVGKGLKELEKAGCRLLGSSLVRYFCFFGFLLAACESQGACVLPERRKPADGRCSCWLHRQTLACITSRGTSRGTEHLFSGLRSVALINTFQSLLTQTLVNS